jgi:hypothetical protein
MYEQSGAQASVDWASIIMDKEYNIRLLEIRYRCTRHGADDDCVIFVLDVGDPYAKNLCDASQQNNWLDQASHPTDHIRLRATRYSAVRERFSPNDQRKFDAARVDQIRVAFLTDGRTIAVVMPEQPWKDMGLAGASEVRAEP